MGLGSYGNSKSISCACLCLCMSLQEEISQRAPEKKVKTGKGRGQPRATTPSIPPAAQDNQGTAGIVLINCDLRSEIAAL